MVLFFFYFVSPLRWILKALLISCWIPLPTKSLMKNSWKIYKQINWSIYRNLQSRLCKTALLLHISPLSTSQGQKVWWNKWEQLEWKMFICTYAFKPSCTKYCLKFFLKSWPLNPLSEKIKNKQAKTQQENKTLMTWIWGIFSAENI